ncbi:MAG: FAD-dependent oxidoreductase [Candidatus Hydrogenedentota bacterium]
MRRRTFLLGASGIPAALAIRGRAVRAGAPEVEGLRAGDTHVEPERDIPVREMVDVLVCGSGPAGICAAVAAARAGASVRVIENNGCLGGIWTSGLLSWIYPVDNKPVQELRARLEGMGWAYEYPRNLAYHPEAMKVALEDMCREEGIGVRLHSRVTAAVKDEDERVRMVVTESKSGREAWPAKVFIDCTGDGDAAAFAGCRYEIGDPEDGRTQPWSMLAVVTGIDAGEVRPYVRELGEEIGERPVQNLLDAIEEGGVSPSYRGPRLFYLREGMFMLMANQEYGGLVTDADEITQGTMQGRREVWDIVKALRSLGHPWENLRLAATAEHIGIREGRRIRGHYTVTREDLENGTRHEDAVCEARHGVNVHNLWPPDDREGRPAYRVSVDAYDIPFRALIAADVDGLLMAGRCISGDFHAHGSYRITGYAAQLGQAAGVGAALAAANDVLPQALEWPEIEAALQGVQKRD